MGVGAWPWGARVHTWSELIEGRAALEFVRRAMEAFEVPWVSGVFVEQHFSANFALPRVCVWYV